MIATCAERVRPINDYLFVKCDTSEEVTKGGLVIPDTAKEKRWSGVVVSLGPGRLLDSGEREEPSIRVDNRIVKLKPGHHVIYAPFGMLEREIKIDGDSYRFVKAGEIFGVLEGE